MISLHFRRMVLTVMQKTNLRGAGPEVQAPRRQLPQKPTEITGTLIRKHPQKREERAQRHSGGKTAVPGDGGSEGEVSKSTDSCGALRAEPLTQREEGRWGGKGVTTSKEPAASMQSALAGCGNGASITLRWFSGASRASLRGRQAREPCFRPLWRPGITGSRALALDLLHHTKTTVNRR